MKTADGQRTSTTIEQILQWLDISITALSADVLVRELLQPARVATRCRLSWLEVDADGRLRLAPGSAVAGDYGEALARDSCLSRHVLLREPPQQPESLYAALPLMLAQTPRAVVLLHSLSAGEMTPTARRLLDALRGSLEATLLRFDEQRRASEAEEQLDVSESRFRTMVQNLGEGVAIVDLTERFVFVNPAGERIFGYSAGALRGMRLRDLVPPSQFDLLLQHSELRRQGLASTYEHQILRRDGTLRDLIVTATPQYDNEGCHLGNFATFRDITERKRMEKELRATEENQARLSRALEQSGESILITDTEGIIQYVNPAVERISGFEASDLIGNKPNVFKSGVHPPEFYEQMWACLLRGESWKGVITNRCKDGRLLEEDVTISPVRDADGRVINYVAVKRDVTQEHEMHARLSRTQKMEAIARLAGGLAHDFNNALMVISSSAEMLEMQLGGEDPRRRRTEEIVRSAKRAAGMTRQLLTFSRREIVKPEVFNFSGLVRQTAGTLASSLGAGIQLVLRGEEQEGWIKADPGQVQQVLMNLCTNAREAMPRGGTLTIALGTAARERDYVTMEISDTGCGMSAEVQARIFEPFFTARPEGHAGLGLATVYGIVQQCGGFIEVLSQVGKGSCFKCYFPRAADEARAGTPKPAENLKARGETILLAEDEARMRSTLAEYLCSMGYRVLTAEDGCDALRVAATAGPIDLLLTDVMMPNMDGHHLQEQLAAERPDMKVLFMSGYTEDEVLRRGVMSEHFRFLQKPFSFAQLARKLREALTPQ